MLVTIPRYAANFQDVSATPESFTPSGTAPPRPTVSDKDEREMSPTDTNAWPAQRLSFYLDCIPLSLESGMEVR